MSSSALRSPAAVHRCPGTPRWRPEGTDATSSTGRTLACEEPPRPRLSPTGHGDRAAVARRRRLAARRRRVVLAALVAGILVALALPWGGVGRPPLATPGPVLAGATVSAHASYVVQPGDTMWSIAERLDPGGDPRPLVAALEAQVGSDTLQPGERLRLP